jgi:ferredoxin
MLDSVPDELSIPVAEVPVTFDVDKIKPWLDTHFEDDFWEEMAMKCLGCGACSYLCPTCHCFDVVDEADWQRGERRRNYDCCIFGLFTLHTSGHNPRPAGANRCRNRLMHKYKYFVERFDRRACVGCGRCMRVCGAGQNLIKILEHIASQPVPEAVAEGSEQPTG